jgi:EamA domain-containing membrane protein RarD
MDILITIILAICIGALVAIFFSFVWTCVAFIAKAIVHEPATAILGKHIIWMGILATIIIFLLLN